MFETAVRWHDRRQYSEGCLPGVFLPGAPPTPPNDMYCSCYGSLQPGELLPMPFRNDGVSYLIQIIHKLPGYLEGVGPNDFTHAATGPWVIGEYRTCFLGPFPYLVLVLSVLDDISKFSEIFLQAERDQLITIPSSVSPCPSSCPSTSPPSSPACVGGTSVEPTPFWTPVDGFFGRECHHRKALRDPFDTKGPRLVPDPIDCTTLLFKESPPNTCKPLSPPSASQGLEPDSSILDAPSPGPPRTLLETVPISREEALPSPLDAYSPKQRAEDPVPTALYQSPHSNPSIVKMAINTPRDEAFTHPPSPMEISSKDQTESRSSPLPFQLLQLQWSPILHRIDHWAQQGRMTFYEGPYDREYTKDLVSEEEDAYVLQSDGGPVYFHPQDPSLRTSPIIPTICCISPSNTTSSTDSPRKVSGNSPYPASSWGSPMCRSPESLPPDISYDENGAIISSTDKNQQPNICPWSPQPLPSPTGVRPAQMDQEDIYSANLLAGSPYVISHVEELVESDDENDDFYLRSPKTRLGYRHSVDDSEAKRNGYDQDWQEYTRPGFSKYLAERRLLSPEPVAVFNEQTDDIFPYSTTR